MRGCCSASLIHTQGSICGCSVSADLGDGSLTEVKVMALLDLHDLYLDKSPPVVTVQVQGLRLNAGTAPHTHTHTHTHTHKQTHTHTHTHTQTHRHTQTDTHKHRKTSFLLGTYRFQTVYFKS